MLRFRVRHPASRDAVLTCIVVNSVSHGVDGVCSFVLFAPFFFVGRSHPRRWDKDEDERLRTSVKKHDGVSLALALFACVSPLPPKLLWYA